MAAIIDSSDSTPISGTAGNDTILGRGGDDSIQGLGGDDLIIGGMGSDAIRYGAKNNAGSNVVFGSEGQDTIISAGSSGANSIIGGTGEAAIDATADGADYIDISADTGRDLVLGNYGDDTIVSESDLANGGGFADLGQNGGARVSLVGGYGNDLILNEGPSAIILGNQGDDSIRSFSDASSLFGGAGDDVIEAFGNDLIVGGEGADTIGVFRGDNTVTGGTNAAAIDSQSGAAGDGNDLIVIGAFKFDIDAGVIRSPIETSGNDLVLGNYGDDTIDAGRQYGGTDTLVGGQGNDSIRVGYTTDDLIFGNQGNDFIVDTRYGAGDTVAGGMGDDTIVYGSDQGSVGGVVYGDEGSNTISIRGGADDTVYGGNASVDAAGNGDGLNFIDLSGVASVEGGRAAPSELVFGGSGNDNILVGSALDVVTMTGGAGQDVYGFGVNANSDSTAGAGSGLDTVTDFVSGTDKLALGGEEGSDGFVPKAVASAGIATQSSLADAADAALLVGGVTGADAVTFRYGADNYLVADIDGSGSFASGTDVLIDIRGTSSLAKGDFILGGPAATDQRPPA